MLPGTSVDLSQLPLHSPKVLAEGASSVELFLQNRCAPRSNRRASPHVSRGAAALPPCDRPATTPRPPPPRRFRRHVSPCPVCCACAAATLGWGVRTACWASATNGPPTSRVSRPPARLATGAPATRRRAVPPLVMANGGARTALACAFARMKRFSRAAVRKDRWLIVREVFSDLIAGRR